MHIIHTGPSGADGVKLHDINGDGFLDIVTPWEESNASYVYLHPGVTACKEVWPKVKVGNPKAPEDAFWGDFDGDGMADVISCPEKSGLLIHWAPGTVKDILDAKKWKTDEFNNLKKGWMQGWSIQLDNKNGLDFVAAGKARKGNTGLHWFESPENPRDIAAWKSHLIVHDVEWAMGIRFYDMDGDGDMEVLLTDRAQFRCFVNPGPGDQQNKAWEQHIITSKLNENDTFSFFSFGDIDGDDVDEIAFASDISILRRPNNVYSEWKRIPVRVDEDLRRAKVVQMGDIDGDGKDEILYSSGKEYCTVAYLEPISDDLTQWREVPISHVGPKYDRIELYDVDQDGDLDVITCEENAGKKSKGFGVIWYENPLHNSNE